jgi:serine/threonine-protein phosphatase 5
VENSYTGPKLDSLDQGKFGISLQFVQSMIQWFKDGKTLPRRYVWEIVLGAYSHFAAEESLVDLDLGEGVTVDVIGDVHGSY